MTSGPGQATDLLLDIVGMLNELQIDYAVIGALAVSVHGVVRASLDADALVSANLKRLEEIGKAAAAQGLQTELRRGDFADPIPAMLLITDQYGNRVDLLAGLRGLDPAVYDRTVNVQIAGAGAALRIVGQEDLIAMKLFAGGPQDLVDARRTMAVARESLDIALLRQLCARFGSDTVQHCEQLLQELRLV